MKSGIYKIQHASGKAYVGSSQNMSIRWKDHKNQLRSGKHHSIKLQNAWNKHTEIEFSFEVIEEVSIDRLIEREQYWMDAMDAWRSGYNVAKFADCPNRGRPVSQEMRSRLSKALKGRGPSEEIRAMATIANTGSKASPEKLAKMSKAFKGRVFTDETRLKMSLAQKSRQERMSIEVKRLLDAGEPTPSKKKYKQMSEQSRANISVAQKLRRQIERQSNAQKDKP